VEQVQELDRPPTEADLDEAQEELKTATRSNPGSRQRIRIGPGYVRPGDLVSAVENLEKAVDLDPANPEYHYNLGLALRLKGGMGRPKLNSGRPSGIIRITLWPTAR